MKNQILSLIGSKVFKSEYRGLLESQFSSYESQDKAFERLVKSLKKTKIGSCSGLSKNKLTRNDWIRSSFAQDYDNIEPLVQSCLRGKRGELFEGPPLFVGLSSGTTGRNSKLIPFSEDTMSVFRRFQRKVASIVHEQSNINFLSEGRVTWGTNPSLYQDDRGVNHGYVSGYLSVKSPKILRRTNFPRVETMLINDMEVKLEEALVELMEVNHIRVISGVPSYLIQLLESLCVALGSTDLSSHWPQMDTVVYSGTTISPYKERIEKLLGKPIKFVGIYVSTECPFGFEIPELNFNKSGVYSLNLEDVVFSFKKIDSKNDQLMSLEDLRVGDEVEVLVSMPNGLLNYRTGDSVKVTSVLPYLFELCGRIGQGLNLSTEKVTQSQLARTVEIVNSELSGLITHYFVSPDVTSGSSPRYRWTLFINPNSAFANKPETLAELLDKALMSENGDYEESRVLQGFLDVPRVDLYPSSWIQEYFQKKCINGQLKIKTTFESFRQMEDFVLSLKPKIKEFDQVGVSL